MSWSFTYKRALFKICLYRKLSLPVVVTGNMMATLFVCLPICSRYGHLHRTLNMFSSNRNTDHTYYRSRLIEDLRFLTIARFICTIVFIFYFVRRLKLRRFGPASSTRGPRR